METKKGKKKKQRRACRNEEKGPSLRPLYQARKHPLVTAGKKKGNKVDEVKRDIRRCGGPEHHQAVLSMDESPPG